MVKNHAARNAGEPLWREKRKLVDIVDDAVYAMAFHDAPDKQRHFPVEQIRVPPPVYDDAVPKVLRSAGFEARGQEDDRVPVLDKS